MAIINRIGDYADEMTAWRRDLHAHPELMYEEHRTAAFVADKLKGFGVDEVHAGLAKTGVLGVIRGNRRGDGAVGLRADMDALPIHERTGAAYASTVPGRMHACGHDGHTAMLLGAARYLAETRNFAGTVYVIFQPAEEGGAGAQKMVEEGLFERFPMQQVYGMHNWPGLPVGAFAINPGATMAATDNWDVALVGRGGHAAMPHQLQDPVVAAAALIQGLQTIAARNVKPIDAAVVSVTRLGAGDAYNVVPSTVTLAGTARTFLPEVRDLVERRMGELAEGIAAAYGMRAEVRYHRGYPATVNHARETALAADAAAEIVGDGRVDRMCEPVMGGEDFAFMLNVKPGSYIRIGNGPADGERQLHNAHYDFNDDALPYGASYWVRLAERLLPVD